ncbi:MAG: prepilin-type N-terminal cleavage/methylation domain-containing protein [Synergistaceae bacterium]|jgi:prepilin-type N-terminal cleavage/methylation domain-containing protein|nr:prepilin-type N-terminal cleavage/methylation domain-containing protein [Synergistaceae bacterium]
MKGFTLVEVLVSLAVMSLVVAASLKLAALSGKGLSQVREREAIIEEAYKMQTELMLDPMKTFGKSGDIEWNVEDMEDNSWLERLSAMNGLRLGGREEPIDLSALMNDPHRWREIEIKRDGKSIMLFLPYSEEAAANRSGDGGLSLDMARN